MRASLISNENNVATVQIKIDLRGSMLNVEESIQEAVNEVGKVATAQKLMQFDTDGSPIVIGSEKLTVRSKDNKAYQTPYGEVDINRYVYQTSKGGKTYIPLEESARIINTSTPRFAKTLSNKYARMSAGEVVDDLTDNHGRRVSRSFLQNVTDTVGSIAIAKEEKWSYAIPQLENPVRTISLSLDGAMLLMRGDGYREAMVGALSLYDREGERQHSIYIASEPEYGKARFLEKMEEEIARIKAIYPNATYVGVADGAKTNWTFLEQHTEKQIIDFYHATEYLAEAATGMFPKKSQATEKAIWLEAACHDLKHKYGSASRIMKKMAQSLVQPLGKQNKKKIAAAVTYFKNNKIRMKYHDHVKNNLPIGSGVTEAACKTVIKHRLCGSGMQWKDRGVKIILSLRPLVKTKDRWNQFWEKISQFGIPHIV